MKDKEINVENYIGKPLSEFEKLNIVYRVIMDGDALYLSCAGDERVSKGDGYFIYLKDGLVVDISKANKPFFEVEEPLKDKWVWFRKKRVELGDGHIIQYTLFESKKNFGIILYHWKTIKQNRFHSHAFPANAFLLSGGYTEEVIEDGKIITKEVNQLFKRRFIPRHYIHRILQAKPRTWTLVITGKWAEYWYEYFPALESWRKYTWGRKKMGDFKGNETFKILGK